MILSERWPGATDAYEELGEPWTTYGRLIIAEDDARLEEQHAAFRQDFDGVARAGLKRQEAQDEIRRFRQHHVSWLMQVISWAVQDNPTAWTAIIDPSYRAELDRTQAAVIECEQRLDRTEARV